MDDTERKQILEQARRNIDPERCRAEREELARRQQLADRRGPDWRMRPRFEQGADQIGASPVRSNNAGGIIYKLGPENAQPATAEPQGHDWDEIDRRIAKALCAERT